MTRIHRLTACGFAAIASVLLAVGLVAATPAHRAQAAGAPTSVFSAVGPLRLTDTRTANCQCTRLDANTIRVTVLGRGQVPGNAASAALTLTITGTNGPGYATIWPSGSARPDTSNLNWKAGQTRANGAIIALGAGGAVDVYVSDPAQILLDMTGAFTPVSSDVGAGRYIAIPPGRLLDTRNSGGPVQSGSTVRVPLPTGVPADALAVAVNITAVDSQGWGFISAFPAGSSGAGTSSVVNTDGPGQTRAATAIVPVSTAGIDLYVDGTANVLVDVFGWFTGASSAPSSVGMFVANAPLRFLDTRPWGEPVWGGGTIEADDLVINQGTAALESQLDKSASAVVFNLTAVDAPNAGYLTAYGARTPLPGTSSLNWSNDETVANLAISPWSSQGGAAFFSLKETDLLVDVTGYFTGTPVPATLGAAPNNPPTYTGETAAALIQDSVPSAVWAVIDGTVDMQVVDSIQGGAAGVASTPPDRIRFAKFIWEGRKRTVQRSVAAHEVGHILTYRWAFDLGGDEDEVFAIGGHECIAEAIAKLFYAQLGRANHYEGYGGFYHACSTSPEASALANEIVDATT